eukprot:TRINITY_DN2877_c0_g1_i3.p1 TRINITY_DN2877_c0_g1~~TRINITY_DN2877_c0_g1_i3.p1  ORF type:complete len:148 (-),score=27.67 TRINITY_DN2877_c0_g1_i3:315-758(-)
MKLRTIFRAGLQLQRGCHNEGAHYHPAIPAQRAKARINSADTPVTVDLSTIQLLERLSLVDFANVEGLKRLESAIQLADSIKCVDTTSIEPLYTILENEKLVLREDVSVEPENRETLMGLASRTEEGYYQTPKGNVPLAPMQTYDRT